MSKNYDQRIIIFNYVRTILQNALQQSKPFANHTFPSFHGTQPIPTSPHASDRSPRQKGKSRRAARSPGYAADSNLRRKAGKRHLSKDFPRVNDVNAFVLMG